MGELAFTAALVRGGYDIRNVDAFLLRIDQTLRGTAESPITARDLVTAKFRRVLPMSLGYARAEVDAFLFDIAPAVIRANSARAEVPAGHAPGPAAGGRLPEQRGWLGRLCHRTS